MKRLLLCLAVLGFVSVSTLRAIAQEPAKPTQEEKRVADANNRFAANLYGHLSSAKESADKNLFFSPFSIETALAMTMAGAKEKTADQMYATLGFPVGRLELHDPELGHGIVMDKKFPELSSQMVHQGFKALLDSINSRSKDGAYQLSVANALWGQKGLEFKKEFLEVTEKQYGGGLRQTDFAGDTEGSRNTINKWVEEQTKEKIKELLKPGIVTPDTRLVLTNAIYFKGDWNVQFDKKLTQDLPFFTHHPANVDVKPAGRNVPMMHHPKAEFSYLKEKGFQALELPYVKKELSMIVILPDTRVAEEFAEFEKTLTAENIDKWLKAMHPQKVEVYLPKFKVTAEFKLNDTLVAMGMTDAFDPAKADFSGMTEKEKLFISAVVHKAFVDVNEEGTEAAGATAVVVAKANGHGAPPPTFRADHPFIFMIRDNRSGAILFMGRVLDPTK